MVTDFVPEAVGDFPQPAEPLDWRLSREVSSEVGSAATPPIATDVARRNEVNDTIMAVQTFTDVLTESSH